MSDKKIVPPDNMIETVLEALCKRWDYEEEVWPSVKKNNREQTEFILITAITWLAEHPRLPLEKEYYELFKKYYRDCIESGERPYFVYWRFVGMLKEWQSQMFLAPEPEIPNEIKEFIVEEILHTGPYANVHNYQIIEAFRRGQNSIKEKVS